MSFLKNSNIQSDVFKRKNYMYWIIAATQPKWKLCNEYQSECISEIERQNSPKLCYKFSLTIFVSCSQITWMKKTINHDDVIKWKHFPRHWPFVRGIHRCRWIPHTKASNAELWCFLWSAIISLMIISISWISVVFTGFWLHTLNNNHVYTLLTDNTEFRHLDVSPCLKMCFENVWFHAMKYFPMERYLSHKAMKTIADITFLHWRSFS